MNTRFSSLSILLLLAILFASCVDPNEIIDNIGDASFSAKINGEDFSVIGPLVTADYSEQSQIVATIGIVAAKLPIGGITEGFALAIVSTDSSGIQVGDIFSATSTEKAGAGEYVLEDGNAVDVNAFSSNTGVASITITAIDFDKKIISGTFSFDAVDDDDPNTVYEIREGKFTDVSFE